MTKFKLFLDVEKEEAWLDAMAEEGWRLDKVIPSIGKYTFTKVSEGEFCPKTRIDFRMVPKNERAEYIELFRESGWENICASNINAHYYFHQMSEESDDDIFSDKSSALQRDKRIGNICAIASTALFVVCILNIINIIDAVRNGDSFSIPMSAVCSSVLFAVGVVLFLIGARYFERYQKRVDADIVVIEKDGAIARDRTTGIFTRRLIVLMAIGFASGVAIGALMFLIER